MRLRLLLPFFSFVLALTQVFGQNTKQTTAPNIVLIFTDDLGYGDLSSYGALDYKTPHLDQMAANGMRFTNFMAAQAVCSASRAALLTGCYPNRIGISGALFPNSKTGIGAQEKTMAEVLKEKGYATAIFGKWHLGDHADFSPLKHGFDEFVGLPYSNDMWPLDYSGVPYEKTHGKSFYPRLPLFQGTKIIRTIDTMDDQGGLTETYTKEAVRFIKENKKKPFFIYVPHSMPHVPIAASKRFKGKSGQGVYGDVVMEIDWSVGEILKTLKENGLEENTLVIFTSDNGPWLNFGDHAGSTGGLREGKGSSTEGGQRVPCVMQWKGKIPEGVVCNQLASTIDLLPTFAALSGGALPSHKIDGVNIWSLMEGDLTAEPRKEFYYYYRKNSLEGVRQGNWKLVLPHKGRSYEGLQPGNGGLRGKTDENKEFPLALFDLRRDPGERYDVQGSYPEVMTSLMELAEKARQDLGDDITDRKGANLRPIGHIQE
ncbi:arylsulfatase [Dyadobacter jejuensis]|uniref:Arylsulfatase n=1 Tax=Dyadobacter jejuensis TaxID=1082580 RepID=A0A316AFX9_9BACT|nr:sulfatase [Dyadobacter jejuensis]PWJ56695.1 arylsulfatase [Dyadobacter jejuensis]